MRKSYWKCIKNTFSFAADLASHEEIKNRIINDGKVTGTKVCILFLASLIVCAGLSLNSIAVIIGAMLITEIFGSILAMAYAAASIDLNLFKSYMIGCFIQIIVALVASILYFQFFSIDETTSEIFNRVKTPKYDIVIAVCGGLIGVLGYMRKVKANSVIYGATIVVILLPPLCICGYAISKTNMAMLVHATFSFMANLYFIFLSSYLLLFLMRILNIIPVEGQQVEKIRKKMIRTTILVIIPAFIIGYSMVHL